MLLISQELASMNAAVTSGDYGRFRPLLLKLVTAVDGVKLYGLVYRNTSGLA